MPNKFLSLTAGSEKVRLLSKQQYAEIYGFQTSLRIYCGNYRTPKPLF